MGELTSRYTPNKITRACRLRKKAAEAEAELPAEPDEEDEEEEEEESEYETDSEDEGFGRALLKPVFVPRVWLRAGCHAHVQHVSCVGHAGPAASDWRVCSSGGSCPASSVRGCLHHAVMPAMRALIANLVHCAPWAPCVGFAGPDEG